MFKNSEDTSVVVFIALLFLGVSIMLYPIMSNFLNINKYDSIISKYKVISDKKVAANKKKLIDEAIDYNKNLKKINASVKLSSEKLNEYNSLLNITKDGIMGFIDIPKIDVKLPIFHGTSDNVLKKGAGHLIGTSLPVGGKTSHSVISAHRGMPSSKLFTDLNQLEEGDVFYIYILDEVHAYQVDKISVVKPDDLNLLNLSENKDYVTLLTCTPYGINTHRLLVRGIRIDYDDLFAKKVAKSKRLFISDIVMLIGFDITFLMIIILIILKKRLFLKNELIISKK